MVSKILIFICSLIKGCLEDDSMEIGTSLNDIYYPGYPGLPLPHPGHTALEQDPGYAHPYLPGLDTQIQIKDFLWTGSGDGEQEYVAIDSTNSRAIGSGESSAAIGPVNTTAYTPLGSAGRHTQTRNLQEKDRSLGYLDRNSIELYSSTPMQDGVTSTGYYDMPHPEFLIRTVIRNGSDLLKGGVDIQSFKEDMEERLTRTYRQAYSTFERRRRSIHFRGKRSEAENVRVRIHNIRSALPEPEIEILYTVYEDGEQPVLAAEAVKRVDANVDNDDAVLLLGHPLKIKAEPYMKKFEVASPRASKDWLIASVILAVFLALLLIWLLVIVYRQYWRKKQKHSILESISSNSKGNSPSAPRKSPTPSQFAEGGGFTLDRPRPQTNFILDTSDPFNERHQKSGMSTEDITTGRVRLTSYESDERGNKSDGEGMADHSSNNTPDPGKRNKKGGKKREKRRRRGGGLSTSEEEYSDSAFPVKTPENLKVLDDLLEEDLPLPGESGRGNLQPGNPGWAYLPDSPDSNWEETARRVKEEARTYEDTLESIIPPPRSSKSAISYVTRKTELFQRAEEMVPSRPWSATEPRWNADRMFHVKKKGWEGLARGKKNLHHGQLLPGSTESEGEGPPRGRVACWSEGDSPRRCEDEVVEEPAPLIKAIRSELQRFQRRTPGSNTGILIFNEPDNTGQ